MLPGPRSRCAQSLGVTPSERAEVLHLVRSPTTAHGIAARARMVLLLADGLSVSETARRVGMTRWTVRQWATRFVTHRLAGLPDRPRSGRPPGFPPPVAVETVRLACTRPDEQGRSLSQWDCGELAHHLRDLGVVSTISRETVRRILASHGLKPWRHHRWLHGKQGCGDAACLTQITALCDLLTRPLAVGEVVLSVDEKTSLQPRPRRHPTRPACPAAGATPARPVQLEHEYRRDGALTLFAAFDPRTGRVIGQCHKRKRTAEFLAFLAHLHIQMGPEITRIHLVLDHVITHKTKPVQAWLAEHPRFVCHFTPVHCSWMNPVEQWFSVLQRKRLRIPDFASLDDLRLKLKRFITEWNERAHPFAWNRTSVAKVMAKASPEVQAAVKAAVAAATALDPAA